MPILDITPLGSTRSGTAGAVAAIVDYLTRGLQRGGAGIGQAAGYYADRPEHPGIWRGSGVNHETLHGDATPEQLTRMLLGGHPNTGVVLVASTGSSGRAERRRVKPFDLANTAMMLTVQQAAERLGVDPSYVKRVLLATERYNLDATSPERLQPLFGVRDGAGRWRVELSEIDRFIRTRCEPKVVVAYDATFKWEKSISLAWVQADEATRRIIEDALDVGVKTGIAFLETHGLQVRLGDRRVEGEGMWAVQYRHTTNRNLEPQLHDHVVIANISATADGETRTIAARSLFTHATTAGHLAGQAVRHELTRQLGYAWGPVVNGTCDLAGVPEVAKRIMSTRSREVKELAEVYGGSQQARRIAALTTRNRKDEPADREVLEQKWRDQLDYHGFSAADEQALRHQQTVAHRTPKRSDDLYAHLGSPAGVTRLDATFDRNTVIREVIAWDGKNGGAAGLKADDVELLTDLWLASPDVVRLTQGDRQRFTTVEMIRLEETVLHAYQNSFGRHHAVVDLATIQTETILWQNSTGHQLGVDQAAFVQHLVSSGHQFGLGVGPAGTGKTASLAVACRAWEVAGYHPIGATVTGAAADVLAESCAIQTRTVASMIAEINTGHNPFNKHSVLIIDEASTLSNRDHASLVAAITETGAAMRTIGDPAQHRAVEAGGLWSQLLTTYPGEVAQLQVNRRQTAASMSDIRHAGEQLRKGHGAAAVKTLTGTNRLHTAPSATQLIADIVHDWHQDRTLAAATGGAPSRLMAEHHTTRRLLNAAAQDLLRADQTIRGRGVLIGDETIHSGDEIITRTQNRTATGDNGRFLRNGVVGTVIAVHEHDGRVSVSARFPGYGVFQLDHDWLTQQIRPGVIGAIAPAYAITTHVAQGQTMEAGRAVITDNTTAPGAYVALTRVRNDTRLYVLDSPARINRQHAANEAEFPVLLNEPELLEAVAERLNQRQQAETATGIDREAGRIHQLSLQPISELLGLGRSMFRGERESADKAVGIALDRAALHAAIAPPRRYVDDYGPAPERTDPNRKIWTQAVSSRAQYEAMHGTWDPRHTPHPTSGGYLSIHHRIAREAWIDGRTFLELEAMLSREGRPEQLRELTTALTRRVDRAIDTKASYIIELLGERQSGAILGPLWDQRARAIETTRLRNGICSEGKPLANTVESILGPKRDDAEWKQAAEIINDAIEPPAEKQTRSRSLRR